MHLELQNTVALTPVGKTTWDDLIDEDKGMIIGQTKKVMPKGSDNERAAFITEILNQVGQSDTSHEAEDQEDKEDTEEESM